MRSVSTWSTDLLTKESCQTVTLDADWAWQDIWLMPRVLLAQSASRVTMVSDTGWTCQILSVMTTQLFTFTNLINRLRQWQDFDWFKATRMFTLPTSSAIYRWISLRVRNHVCCAFFHISPCAAKFQMPCIVRHGWSVIYAPLWSWPT